MSYPLLTRIKNPRDLDNLSFEELKFLSCEIRERILQVLSVNGGHLSSNLGIVELTIALHKVFDSPNDKFIFDTSHQSYTHKLLTGRESQFDTLRQFKGICGFSHPDESIHDHFFSGHAGATFSAALGLAKSRDLNGESFHVVPIMGDGSLTCGLTLEALNNIPSELKNFVVVLNDNNMAISKNVGNIKNILSRLINHPTSNKLYLEIQEKIAKIPNIGNFLALGGQKIKESIKNLVSSASFFEQFGLSYVGPIDGHDLKKLVETFAAIKNLQKPVIVHVLTIKGKGMLAAKENPTSYHGVKPFNLQSGKFLETKKKPTFPQIFGRQMLELAKKDPSIVVLSPAMLSGSCLAPLKEVFPERCIDVGIAEGHCVTFAGGLALLRKNKVVACLYSTFLQRALDNVFHDVCLQKLPVVFAIDRAGLCGPDGATHHGIYDIGFLNAMPNMVICQPRDGDLLKDLLTASFYYKSPIAIRYPNLYTEETLSSSIKINMQGEKTDNFEQTIKLENPSLLTESGKEREVEKSFNLSYKEETVNEDKAAKNEDLESDENKAFFSASLRRPLGKGEILKEGKDLLLISLGHHFKTAFEVASLLEKEEIYPTIVDPIFLKPLDSDLFFDLFSTHKHIVTIEEHSLSCGLGSIINSFALKHSFNNNQIINFGICDTFVQHGQNEELLKEIGLDAENIAKNILNRFDLIKHTCEINL